MSITASPARATAASAAATNDRPAGNRRNSDVCDKNTRRGGRPSPDMTHSIPALTQWRQDLSLVPASTHAGAGTSGAPPSLLDGASGPRVDLLRRPHRRPPVELDEPAGGTSRAAPMAVWPDW